MIRINLVVVPKLRKQETLVYQAAGALLFLIGIFSACYFWGLTKQDQKVAVQQRNEVKKQEIRQLEASVGEVEKFKQQVRTLEEQLGVIRALENGRSGPVKMMDELTEIVPRRLWITSFREVGKRVTVEGLAESGMVIADFLDNLKASRFFQNPSLVGVNAAEQEGVSLQKFSITLSVRYDS